jgi:hypothetical protein
LVQFILFIKINLNRYYENADENVISKVVRFNPGPSYKTAEREGSYDEHGDRSTKFGANVYASAKPSDTTVQPGPATHNSANIQSDWVKIEIIHYKT